MSEFTNNSYYAQRCRLKAQLTDEYKSGGGPKTTHSERMAELHRLLFVDGDLKDYPALSPTRLRMLEWTDPDGEQVVRVATGTTHLP